MAAPLIRLVLVAAMLSAAAAPSAGRAAPGAEELEQVLHELREVETRIERYLIEETHRGASRRPLPAAEKDPLPSANALPEAAPSRAASLRDELGLGVSDEIQELARAKVEARMRLAEAETGMRLSSILLLDELAGNRRDNADLLTLALIQGRHRAGANLAVEELLRLEQVRFARGTAMASAPEPAAQPEDETGLAPALMSSDESSLVPSTAGPPLPESSGTELEALRTRHRELSERLNALSTRAEQSRPRALRFGEQRAQLNALMSRLARGGDAGASALAPATAETGGTSGLVPTLPDQDSDPDGRQTFWRATRAGIHALASGKVLFAGPFAGYRHLLILDHGDGWTSLYGNMTQCFVRPDDVLSSGSVLGEYQAEAIGEPEPFWVEIRRGADTLPIENLPGISTEWRTALFEDQAP